MNGFRQAVVSFSFYVICVTTTVCILNYITFSYAEAILKLQ